MNELFIAIFEFDVANIVQILNTSQVGPRKCTSIELDNNIEKSPKIVSSTLILTKMRIGRHVTTRADPASFVAFRSQCAIRMSVAP